MTRNLILFGVFSLLMIFTFFFEELGQTKKKLEEDAQNRLFNADKLGAMLGLETFNGNKLYFKDGRFYTKKINYLVSREELEKFFDVLSGIKIKRYLNKNEIDQHDISVFIPDSSRKLVFVFEKGTVEFTLGQKLQTDPSFYMQVKTNVGNHVLIAYDDSMVEGIYLQENAHLNSEKYNRIVRLFNMTEEDFLDKKILKEYDYESLSKNLNKTRISNLRNITFEIHSENFKTLPSIYSGLAFNREFYNIFMGALSDMKALALWPSAEPKKLGEKIGMMELKSDFNREITLELFRKYDQRAGFFVKTNLEHTVFEVDQNIVRLFFSNVQDFWDKRVISPDNLKKIKQFDFSLVYDKEYLFNVNNSEKFSVTSRNSDIKPKNSGFGELFAFLSTEADLVKEMINDKRQNLFSFTFLDSTFHVIFKEGDLIIIDTKKKLEFYFHVGDLSRFKHKKSDFIND